MNQGESASFKGFPFIGYWSDRGKAREGNEDSFYVPPQDLSPQLVQSKGYLCIVADGMGGQAKGEVASAMAARRIAEEYYADPNLDPEQSLRRAAQVANTEIYSAAQQPDMGGMGTTMVAAVLIDNRVVVANAGDSRAYLISQGQAIQVSRDHSWVQERVDKGILTPEQARQHAQRNLITRSLGTHTQIEVDVFKPDAAPGDVILLCSDGLSGVVRQEEMARIVSQYPAMEAANRLVALANERGGPDNITAVVLPVGGASGASPLRPSGATTRMLLPVGAGLIAGLILILVAALLGPKLVGQIALALPTYTVSPNATVLLPTTPTTNPTTEPSVVSPAHSQTAAITPSATTQQSPARTEPARTMTPTPYSGLVPPRGGRIEYKIPGGVGADYLLNYFWNRSYPDGWDEFIKKFPDAQVGTPPPNAPPVINGNATLLVELSELPNWGLLTVGKVIYFPSTNYAEGFTLEADDKSVYQIIFQDTSGIRVQESRGARLSQDSRVRVFGQVLERNKLSAIVVDQWKQPEGKQGYWLNWSFAVQSSGPDRQFWVLGRSADVADTAGDWLRGKALSGWVLIRGDWERPDPKADHINFYFKSPDERKEKEPAYVWDELQYVFRKYEA
ncbi:MAG: Stp1/IreP family PP2C-type Ser/Thr phosphatase, partial [Chloroflexota bacterium]|nr:Stp1/IreP family PP2C-type Ser/Thr phosphatase [Chloroflexota bacterium]